MKIFIQDKTTGRFFVQGNHWTKDARTARPFEYIHLAVDFCRQNNLGTASVVVVCKNSKFNIRFAPLSGLQNLGKFVPVLSKLSASLLATFAPLCD
jgi:hypothetical protein